VSARCLREHRASLRLRLVGPLRLLWCEACGELITCLPLRPGGRGTSPTSPQPVGSRPLQAAATATTAGAAG
jgi:hypothetical protein